MMENSLSKSWLQNTSHLQSRAAKNVQFFLRFLVVVASLLLLNGRAFADDKFLEALKAFQTKDYTAAEKNYVTLLEKNPEDPTLLTNLGLTYWEMQKKGLAIGYFRHALVSDPSFEQARKALNFSLSQFPIEKPPHDVVALEWIHENILASVSLWTLALLHLLTFVGLFWCVLTLAKPQPEGGRQSSAALLSLISIFGMAWLFSLVLLIFKVTDQFNTRATMITSTSALALPDPKSVSLMDLKEGVEVVVRNHQDEWTQVNFPGATTGWVPASSLYIHQKGL